MVAAVTPQSIQLRSVVVRVGFRLGLDARLHVRRPFYAVAHQGLRGRIRGDRPEQGHLAIRPPASAAEFACTRYWYEVLAATSLSV